MRYDDVDDEHYDPRDYDRDDKDAPTYRRCRHEDGGTCPDCGRIIEVR